MPVSNGKPGYTCRSFESFGPANALARAAVGVVAGGEQAVDDRLPIGVREGAASVRLSRRVLRRHPVQHRRHPLVPDPGEARAHRRRADDDPVEVRRVALRHQHALAPAGRAAHEVRVRGGPTVVLRQDLLREHGHAPDRLVGEVETRLLIRHEGGVEGLPAVAGVGGDDGEAAGERGIALPRPAERRRHRAVEAAPALEEEPSVPLGGEGEREADAVAPAVRAGAPVERGAQPAPGGQRGGERRHPRRLLRRGRSGREPLGRHLRQRGAGYLQLPEGRARGLAGHDLAQRRVRGERDEECDDRRTRENRQPHGHLRCGL
jgi:hypothetical protein